jgi:hypothetical protein
VFAARGFAQKVLKSDYSVDTYCADRIPAQKVTASGGEAVKREG